MIKSFSTGTIIVLCTALIEAALLSNIMVLPTVPDLSLICVLYISLQNGKLMGETTGFMSGLFLDFLSASPWGLNCLYRTILGYIGGIFCKTINTDGVFIPCVLGFSATIAKALFIWVISVLYPSGIFSYSPISKIFIFELCANTILTPIIFKFLFLFKNALLLDPEKVI